MTKKSQEIDPNIIIDGLGGTSKTAEMFEIAPASVSDWRKNGIPKPRLMYLKLARPDLFNNESKSL